MVNVFGGMPQQTPPQPTPQDPSQQGQDPDVAQAIGQLVAQDQAGEPTPRQPTPEEMDKYKQTAQQMLAQKRGGSTLRPVMAPRQAATPPPTPPAASQPPPSASAQPGMTQTATSTPFPSASETAGLEAGIMPPEAPPPGAAPATPPDSGGGLNWQNALNLMGKTNPASALQQYAVNNAGDLAKGAKNVANIAGDVAGTGKIFPDQPQPIKPPPASPALPDQGKDGKPQVPLETIAKEIAPHAAEVAKKAVAEGVSNPDQADLFLRHTLGQNPELDQAIKDAKDLYQKITAINNEPPTTMQYIGAILVGLATGNINAMQAILHPNAHLNAQREHEAGQNLMGLQLAKVHGLQQADMAQMKYGEDSAAMKRAESMGQAGNKHTVWETAAKEAMNDAREYEKNQATAVGNMRTYWSTMAKNARDRANFYQQQMGLPSQQQMIQQGLPKPQQPPIAKPISQAPQQQQVSPAAMRMLGLSNA